MKQQIIDEINLRIAEYKSTLKTCKEGTFAYSMWDASIMTLEKLLPFIQSTHDQEAKTFQDEYKSWKCSTCGKNAVVMVYNAELKNKKYYCSGHRPS